MKFKVGDKVKFLNSTGGGIITKLTNHEAYVEIADDFDIPYPLSEIILDGTHEENILSQDRTLQNPKSFVSDVNYDTNITKLIVNEETYQKSKLAYLSFVPENQDAVIFGDLNFYFVNYSNSEILFSLYISDGIDNNALFAGQCPPESKIYLGKKNRSDVLKWDTLYSNILFHNEKPKEIPYPASANLKLKQTKLTKEDNFKRDKFTSLMSFNLLLWQSETDNIVNDENLKLLKYKLEQNNSYVAKKPELSILDKHKVNNKTIEVDLHIQELYENYTKLSNTEIIIIQKSYFIKCLEEAIAKNIYKVIFIHGVGKGVLKTELLQILSEYKGISYYDASMSKYGVGATEVVIHKNR